MDGLDRGWVDRGARRVAYYTNIPPGPYHFRVAAANNDGVWNEEGASFAFELRPHFYEARWFYALCAVATVLLAVGGYELRVGQLAARERKLNQIVSERTRELEQANQMLARFSYLDAVTGIANRRNFAACLDLERRRVPPDRAPPAPLLDDLPPFQGVDAA